MSNEFEYAIIALLDEQTYLSSFDRADLLERIRQEDAKHSSAFVDISTDDEEQGVRVDIAKAVIARWLEERGK